MCGVLDDERLVDAYRAGLGDPRVDAIGVQAPGSASAELTESLKAATRGR